MGTTLQQQIYQSLIKHGEWLDPDGLIKITADLSESGGKFIDATNEWIPDIDFLSIDVLKPEAETAYKGRAGISKLRRKFNEVRFALPEGTYRLHADDTVKSKLYEKWFKNDPFVKVGDTAGKKHRKTGEFIKYNVLDLTVPETLIQIGNHQDTARVVYLRPTTTQGHQHARMLEESYQALGTDGRGLKPYYLGEDGQLAYFKKGKYKGTTANPQGLGFDKIAKHRGRSLRYAGRKTGATPAFDELFTTLKKQFPGVPDEELTSFTEIYQAMNKGEIDALTAKRAMSNVKLHGDHSIALSQGGLNWYNNLRNIPAEENLRKGASNTSEAYNLAKGISENRGATIIGGLSTPIENPKVTKHLGKYIGATLLGAPLTGLLGTGVKAATRIASALPGEYATFGLWKGLDVAVANWSRQDYNEALRQYELDPSEEKKANLNYAKRALGFDTGSIFDPTMTSDIGGIANLLSHPGLQRALGTDKTPPESTYVSDWRYD
tara:strand:+ start:661 stop:2139 length:1479 start_codon:yes stop_codon:yes gene_type:complete